MNSSFNKKADYTQTLQKGLSFARRLNADGAVRCRPVTIYPSQSDAILFHFSLKTPYPRFGDRGYFISAVRGGDSGCAAARGRGP